MRELLIGGARLVTSDGVAGAIMQRALRADENGDAGIVEIPVLVDGSVRTASVLVTPRMPIVALAVSGDTRTLPGEAEALDRLRCRR
jgi:hypothetical protein